MAVEKHRGQLAQGHEDIAKAERGTRGSRGDRGDRGDRGERSTRGSRGTRGNRGTRGSRGSAVLEVLVGVAMLVFVVLPVFSGVMEKYILLEKSRIIRDAVDLTNISAYNALDTGELGMARVDMPKSEVMDIFKKILAANLSLNDDLTPKLDSVAEGLVYVSSLEIYATYNTDFPTTCPNGTSIVRPSVHSSINIPIKPSLYRGVILNLLGKDHIDVVVHVDTEIPLNN